MLTRCKYCNRPFDAKTNRSKFCSENCRVSNHLHRKNPHWKYKTTTTKETKPMIKTFEAESTPAYKNPYPELQKYCIDCGKEITSVDPFIRFCDIGCAEHYDIKSKDNWPKTISVRKTFTIEQYENGQYVMRSQ